MIIIIIIIIISIGNLFDCDNIIDIIYIGDTIEANDNLDKMDNMETSVVENQNLFIFCHISAIPTTFWRPLGANQSNL